MRKPLSKMTPEEVQAELNYRRLRYRRRYETGMIIWFFIVMFFILSMASHQ